MSSREDRAGIVSAVLFLTITVNLILIAMILAPRGHYDPANVMRSITVTYDSNTINQEKRVRLTLPEREESERMELTWRLIETSVKGDYQIETYREYEIYKNSEGDVIRTVPTEHFEYLRYWRYHRP
ncbi:MAG: hypothetical protein H0Z33_02740 [Bacillaceae bacterium]|nr:hypothetical protein [Bacillaceae bacterium]